MMGMIKVAIWKILKLGEKWIFFYLTPSTPPYKKLNIKVTEQKVRLFKLSENMHNLFLSTFKPSFKTVSYI